MADQYHISLFHNSSDTKNASTTKPGVQRDTYFIAKGESKKPDYNVLIEKRSWTSYDQALPHANFIHTGLFAYCFWDTGNNQIAAVTDQDLTKVQVIYKGSPGHLVLFVNSDGTILFGPATMGGWVDLQSIGLYNIPGVPEATPDEIIDTLKKLLFRSFETRPAEEGLSRQYTIGRHKDAAKAFLDRPLTGSNPLGALSLEDPEQFTISWTNYNHVYQRAIAQKLDDNWASELTSIDRANDGFWYHISHFGTAYNLLGIIRRVATGERLAALKTLFGASWQAGLESVQREGRLYEIDFSMFQSLAPSRYREGPADLVRYNPATLTLLEMTRGEKGTSPIIVGDDDEGPAEGPEWTTGDRLVPVLIRVWSEGVRPEIYAPNVATEGAWLYALQAAKTSVTLYGIWPGHVCHWHLVTAAMQKTMLDTIPKDHLIRQLLGPQSSYNIPFNYILFASEGSYSTIAPPTCLAKPEDVLKLADTFAAGRNFFDDDPRNELAKNGLEPAEFTKTKEWDGFPVAFNLTRIFDMCQRFVTVFVTETYKDDKAVRDDAKLRDWMKAAAEKGKGNIRGLPEMNNRDALTRVLTSLVYRVTAHGISRLPNSADPGLSFVANFPPCLQRTDLPPPNSPLSTKKLLEYLPNTGTIGGMLKFYFAFAYSKPYFPLIPADGLNKDLYFQGKPSSGKCNEALIKFREEMRDFIRDFNPTGEAPPPKADFGQWPRNIET